MPNGAFWESMELIVTFIVLGLVFAIPTTVILIAVDAIREHRSA